MVSLCLQTQQKSIYETGGYQTSYLHKTPPKTKHSSLNQNFFFYKRALISTLPFKNDSCFNKDQYNFKKSNREIMRKIKVKYWLITTGLHWSWNRLYTSPEKKQTKIANPFQFQYYMFWSQRSRRFVPVISGSQNSSL